MRWSSGDYQIAPIAARSTAMGRWRLTPPGYWGTLPAGAKLSPSETNTTLAPLRGDTSSAPFGGTFPSRGRLTEACHSTPRTHQGEGLRVRHSHRGPLKGKANGGTPFNTADLQGEGLGDKKKRPGALLLALFISFWQCRSGRSETGVTGRRRGLRRGRRSWGPRWAAPRAGRSSSRRFGVFPPTWPADAGDASPAY